jgi:hypothetical protein
MVDSPSALPGIWCVVANVTRHQEFGELREVRLGTRHFSPGTKVYCLPAGWGDGYEDIRVLGRHRGRHRLCELVMPSKRLTNWRAKVVYHPHVVVLMQGRRWSEEDARAIVVEMEFREAYEHAKRYGFEHVTPDDALLFAAWSGSVDELQRALARGANVDAARAGWNGLTLAVYHWRPEAVTALLEVGADAGRPVGSYGSALEFARKSYHTEFARQLELSLLRRPPAAPG